MNITFDEIYGVDIKDYCKIHGITPSILLQRVKTDLEILYGNFRNEVENKDTNYEVTRAIADTIAKKQAHLRRLERIVNGTNK